MKLSDNAVIKCCGECHPPSDKCPHWNTGVGKLRELKTIDPSCPLKECDLITDPNIIKNYVCFDENHKLIENPDFIIIVRREGR